jgi:hypothetical protein
MLFVTKEPLFTTPPTLPKVTGVYKYKPNIFFQGRKDSFITPTQSRKKFYRPPTNYMHRRRDYSQLQPLL